MADDYIFETLNRIRKLDNFRYCDCIRFSREAEDAYMSPCKSYYRNLGALLSTCKCPYKFGGTQIESQAQIAWTWSQLDKTAKANVTEDGLSCYFHADQGFSAGNACVRGDVPLAPGYHHFWEMRIMTPVYGTSVMVGVGTGNVAMSNSANSFGNLLGTTNESWGFDFNGRLHHNGTTIDTRPAKHFTMGSIVGVYLDTWNGTLEFFVNREPVGKKFRGIKFPVLYPMVASTAAHSCLTLSYSISTPHSLSHLILRSLSPRKLQRLPFALRKKIESCWWFFPNSYQELTPGKLEKHFYGKSSLIDYNSDGEGASEGSRALGKRMKRVLENSRPVMRKRKKQ